ncbi:MAG: hypothetical protein U7126_13235 [Microcoleus sp.]|uniref:hypothetical protein n=1 Tax=Microcoleus TaxID=44471 RepID=UPI003593C985
MTQSDRPTDAKTPCIINDRKLDYLFNVNIKPDAHNSKRAVQNRQQLNRLGFDDDSESRQFIQTHLEQAVQEESNIVERFINIYTNHTTGEEATIDTELRDSLLPGRTGKFAQVQSSWEVLPDGTRRFLSAIIYGK